MTDDPTVIYVYGLVRDGFRAARLPPGLDEASVELRTAGGFSALVSRLARAEYDSEAVERNSGNVPWLSPRAMAHDRVLTWAQEHGGVIPLPMFSLFSDERALSTALERQSATLRDAFQRVSDADEFGVRVHRRDDRMMAVVDELDPALATLRAEANAASPGQRYLIERKIAEEGKAAVRAAAKRMARGIFDRLQALSRQAVARPLTPDAGRDADATLVLNGAFLVDRARVEEFRAAVGEIVVAHEPRGLTLDFTGPWPPYHFVSAGEMRESR
jgi:hypothetical protein